MRSPRNACVRRFVRISRRWRSRRPEASGIALAVSSTLVLIMASSSDSSMASSNCMIPRTQPRASFRSRFSCSATENRTRHGSCPLPGSPNHKARRNSVLICGERRKRRVHYQLIRHFNPCSPCGEQPNGMWVIYGTSEFQSTLPLRGATTGERNESPMREISIHTPLAGSDHRVPYKSGTR